jgi:hypothetical protein
MTNKLQNIKAVRQILDGTHKTQTRKTFGFSDAAHAGKKSIRHEVGDVWEETSPAGTVYLVTQHDGFRSRTPKNTAGIKEQIDAILKVPDECPKCSTAMRNEEQRLNFKFWYKRGKCFSCVLKEEQQIRDRGIEAWKEYERSIMRENAEAWFKDADKEVELLKSQVKETIWQNADGRTGDIDISEFIKKMEHDYAQLKLNIRNMLGADDGTCTE